MSSLYLQIHSIWLSILVVDSMLNGLAVVTAACCGRVHMLWGHMCILWSHVYAVGSHVHAVVTCVCCESYVHAVNHMACREVTRA